MTITSIVIPTVDPTLPRYMECVFSIRRYCSGHDYEIITASYGGTFAQNCNEGVRQAKGEQILLLNDDTVLTNDLLEAFRIATEDDEGSTIVGARLLYPDGLVQHAGIGFDTDGGPYNLWRLAPAEHPEVMKRRFLPAVTFACALIPRQIWEHLGGLDEGYINAYEDVDFCIRAREAGFHVVYDPSVTAIHLEGQTQGRNDHVQESWNHYQDVWLRDGRIHYALGTFPFSIQRGGQ